MKRMATAAIIITLFCSASLSQDLDFPDIFLPFSSGSTAWTMTLSSPTVSDCDIVTITCYDAEGGEKTVTAQTRSSNGASAKDKAEAMADDINNASDLAGDPVDAVSSNNHIMITEQNGFKIETISFTNDTKEPTNKIVNTDNNKSIVKSAWIRLSGRTKGLDGNGNRSVLCYGTKDRWYAVGLSSEDKIGQLIKMAKENLIALGFDAWIGVDLNRGVWLIFSSESGDINFGCTDETLEQRAMLLPQVELFHGALITVHGETIYVL